MKDEEGVPRGMIYTLQDITEQKKIEERIHIYQDQLKYMASKVTLAEENERRGIAIRLHDRIGQNLALLKIKLGEIQESAHSADLSVSLGEVRNRIDQAISDTRFLTFELSPPILYELGFEAALEWLSEQMGMEHGISIVFEDDRQPKPADIHIGVILFRAVRELLINIVKHAKAHNAKISVMRCDRNIQVLVEDDGIGFDAAMMNLYAHKNGGFGLFSIKERIEYIGGIFKVKSELEHGTKVTMIVPLKTSILSKPGEKNKRII